MSKTLYDIQVGDEVIVTTCFSEVIEKVTRLTDKYVVVGRTKYRKSDGGISGDDSWASGFLAVATPEAIERIKTQNIHSKLVLEVSKIPFQSLSNEQLQSIIYIAKQNEQIVM